MITLYFKSKNEPTRWETIAKDLLRKRGLTPICGVKVKHTGKASDGRWYVSVEGSFLFTDDVA